jgi:hypothetical protein
VAGLAACSDPSAPSTARITIDKGEEEICPAHANWLPDAPEYSTDQQTFFKPAAHPDSECPFYSLAWQNFLYATKPIDGDGTPRLKTYPVLDDIFTPIQPLPNDVLAPVGEPRGTAKRSWLGLIEQAGFRNVAIDENGRTLYYGIHVNQAFADFIKEQGLTTAYAVQNAPKDLVLPPGMVEFKSAWEQVDNDADTDGWISTKAWVPHISVDKSAGTDPATWKLVEDHTKPTEITVRLLGLHVVVTFPGHPEFFWGHLEHTTVDMTPGATDTDFKSENGFRNLAPITVIKDADGVLLNPDSKDNVDIMFPVSTEENKYVLYKAGTPVNESNVPLKPEQLGQLFDEPSQKFLDSSGQPARTSIYRLFPASKSNTTHPDDAISSLNHNVEAMFRKSADILQANDFRGHYRLVGGQWMDKPAFFALNFPIQNDFSSPLLDGTVHGDEDATQAGDRQTALQGLSGDDAKKAANDDILAHGSDSAFSVLAGEDRMSGMPLESFTQTRGAFSNCFTCHNTTMIASNGVPYKSDDNGRILMPAKLLNVSHVFSEFVRDECDKPENWKKVSELPTGNLRDELVGDPNLKDPSVSTVAVCPPPSAAPAAGAPQ